MNKAAAFLVALLATSPVGARAQLAPSVSDAPIDIMGERLEIEGNVATWTGNVRAVQADAILTAEKLVADLDDDGSFTRIRAIGEVRYSNGKEAITGRVGVYDAAAGTITISEDVVLTQGDQVMTGGELVYWIDSKRVLFTAPSGRRIRGIFHAKQSGQQP